MSDRMEVAWLTLTCSRCEGEFQPKPGRGPNPKYCSTACKSAASLARAKADGRYESWKRPEPAERGDCQACGVTLTGTKRLTFCSDDCYKASVAAAARERYANDPEYRASELARRANRDPEKEAQYREEHREERSEYNRLYRIRTDRRVLELNAPQGTPYTRLAILVRDKYICHICGGLTKRSANKNDDLHPQIDHIIPLTRGGIHGAENVATAHRLCNIRKHNKLMSELPAEYLIAIN